MRTHRTLIAIVVALAGLTAAPTVRAQEQPVRAPADALLGAVQDQIGRGVQWYGVYMQGNKLGTASARVTRRGDGPAAGFRADFVLDMSLASLGQQATMHVETSHLFDGAPPYRLQRYTSSQTGLNDESLNVALQKAGYQATIVQAGETRTQDLGPLDWTMRNQFAVEAWLRGSPAAGAALTVPDFDNDKLAMEEAKFKVLRVRQPLVDGIATRVLDLEHEDAQGSKSDATFDGNGRMLSVQIGGIIQIRLEPEEVAKDLDKAEDLFVNNMVRADKRIGDPTTVKVMRIAVDAALGDAVTGAPGQRVTKQADGSYVIELTRGAEPRPKATEDETKEALESTVEFPIGHADVKSLALKAVADAKTPREQVKRLVAFVSEFIRDEHMIESPSVLEIIRDRAGDCTEHTDLMTVLCRAVGIPCRPVGGIVYMGDETLAFGGHAWNEVVLDGHWVAVDATWNEFEPNATHVRYPIIDSDHYRAMSAARGTTLRVLLVEHAGAKKK